jgi:citrate lyase gamma subunit
MERNMSEQDGNEQKDILAQLNSDSISKRSVAAIAKLVEATFTNAQIELTPIETSDKGDYMLIVHAGERAISALELLVNAGGDTNINQPNPLVEQAEDVRTLPRDDNKTSVVIAPEVLPDGQVRL